MHRHVRSLRLSLVLLAACGPVHPGVETASSTSGPGTGGETTTTPTTGSATAPTGSGGGTGTGSSTGDLSATDAGVTTGVDTTTASDTTAIDTTAADTTAGSTTAGSTSAGSTSTTDTDDPPDTTGADACGGAGPAMFEWKLVVPPALVDVDIDAECTIVGDVMQGPDVTLELSCLIAGKPTTIKVKYTAAPDVDETYLPGFAVHLNYRIEQALWRNEWLAITNAGVLVFGAIRADALAPDGTTPQDFFQEDVSLVMACDAAPDRCGTRQPLGLKFAFEHGGGRISFHEVISGDHMSFGVFFSTDVFLEHASRLIEPIVCDDVPSTWIDAMMLATSNV